MLECVFSNPDTEVICYGNEYITLCSDYWLITGGTDPNPGRKLNEISNTADNPISIPADTFTSYISKQDVFEQTKKFGLSLL